jgi:hypothetical protein
LFGEVAVESAHDENADQERGQYDHDRVAGVQLPEET